MPVYFIKILKNNQIFLENLRNNKSKTLSYKEFIEGFTSKLSCEHISSFAKGSTNASSLSMFFREYMGKGFALTDVDFYLGTSNIMIEEKGFVKDHYVQLTTILRRYFDREYEIDTLESTTDETIQDLTKLKLDAKLLNDISNLLTEADYVKFAKSKPDTNRKIPPFISSVGITPCDKFRCASNNNLIPCLRTRNIPTKAVVSIIAIVFKIPILEPIVMKILISIIGIIINARKITNVLYQFFHPECFFLFYSQILLIFYRH